NWSSAADLTARLKRLVQPAGIYEDTPARYWSEYTDAMAAIHYVVALRAANGYCSLYVDLRAHADAGLRDLGQEVIDTLRPHQSADTILTGAILSGAILSGAISGRVSAPASRAPSPPRPPGFPDRATSSRRRAYGGRADS